VCRIAVIALVKFFTQGGCHGSITGSDNRGDEATELFGCNAEDLRLCGDTASEYHGKAPDQLSKEEIRAFLVHLIVERKLSPNGLTGYCSGLRFFYNETLGRHENKLFIPRRKQSSPLAEVFSPEEIIRLIRAARGLKQRVLLMTAYSAGLRVSELVNLKINDIDPARMTLRIRRQWRAGHNRGVGGVVTVPGAQKKGLARRLMQHTAEFFEREWKVDAGLLFCFPKLTAY
jgi:integrase